MTLDDDDPHLRAIRRFYGARTAARSGVPLIAHVHDGLAILDALDARAVALQAFCLHPIVQGDDDLARAFEGGHGVLAPDALSGGALDPLALVLALEYRRCANAYLSYHPPDSLAGVSLAPFHDVKLMLIADKVQNRRDFERHHVHTHERAAALSAYFARWLAFLDVDESRYRELVGRI